MIYVLCSNDISDSKLYKENDNFQCVILEEGRKTALSMNESLRFNLFYALDEDYEQLLEDYGVSDKDYDYQYTLVAYLHDYIDIVVKKISDYYTENIRDINTDDDDAGNVDLMVVSALPGKTGRKLIREINETLRKKNIDITVINLYEMYGCEDITMLTNVLKKRLGTEFIYPEDPFHLAYAIYRTLGIGRIK